MAWKGYFFINAGPFLFKFVENVLEALCKTSVLFKLELVNYPSDLKSITDVTCHFI